MTAVAHHPSLRDLRCGAFVGLQNENGLNTCVWLHNLKEAPQSVCSRAYVTTAATLAHRGLWCVFELAAYKKVNPDGRITFRPLFIEQTVLAILLCSCLVSFLCLFTRDVLYDNAVVLLLIFIVPHPVAICVLRMNFRQKHQLLYQLDNFDLDTVQCSQHFDSSAAAHRTSSRYLLARCSCRL